uniref:Uncharacterized protein n=1 Tax=Arundo donax TaxID=35708 RepID=A0A0A9GSA3_ARUDO
MADGVNNGLNSLNSGATRLHSNIFQLIAHLVAYPNLFET